MKVQVFLFFDQVDGKNDGWWCDVFVDSLVNDDRCDFGIGWWCFCINEGILVICSGCEECCGDGGFVVFGCKGVVNCYD